MFIITSINPKQDRIEDQQIAINSWINLGLNVVSFNLDKESKELIDLFPKVEFITPKETTEKLFGKPYIKISEILDYAENEEVYFLSNSDIIFDQNKERLNLLIRKGKEGLVYITRFNFNQEKFKAKIEPFGIDTFILSGKIRNIYPKNDLSLGQCFWDYWMPYYAIKNNIKLYHMSHMFCFHKNHMRLWNFHQWEIAFKIFKEETGRTEMDSIVLSKNLREEIDSYKTLITL